MESFHLPLLLLLALQGAGAVTQHCRVTEVCRECRTFERAELPAACASTGHREEVSCPNPQSEKMVVYLRPCRARRNGFDDQLDDLSRMFTDGMRRFSSAFGSERALTDGELLNEMEETSMELHVEGGAAEDHSAPIAGDDSQGTAEVLRFELVVLFLLAISACCVANTRRAAMLKRTRAHQGTRTHSAQSSRGHRASVLPTASRHEPTLPSHISASMRKAASFPGSRGSTPRGKPLPGARAATPIRPPVY